jgi:hypothetical protein
MLTLLLLQIKVFLFIMAWFTIILNALHIVSVFRFKHGKLFANDRDLTIFGVSLAYIITILICGF